MKTELKLEQGSEEWLAFRRNHRMASETPGVMSLSSYQSPNDVRNAKIGKSVFVNAAMRQGTEQEPIARAVYENLHEPMRPAVYVEGEYGCSLDGISIDEDVILEVKTPFKNVTQSERWVEAERGALTASDYAQVQHQLMVTGCSMAHFWVWNHETQTGILVEVLPNPDFWQLIKNAWDDFWPTLIERTDKAWLLAASEYLEAKTASDAANDRLEAAKTAITAISITDQSFGGGVTVNKVKREGSVDWPLVRKKHLSNLSDDELNQFRKKGSEYFTVTVSK